jgi:uncharacterized membrane protein
MPEQMEQTPQPPQTQPSTGMTEDGTCGIAYLTVVPAIIFLVTAPYNQNPKVRFHAWQCICLTIAAVALSILLQFLWVIPGINLLNIFIEPVVFLGIGILWLIAMINAFQGKIFKIPVIAGFAAKQSGAQI